MSTTKCLNRKKRRESSHVGGTTPYTIAEAIKVCSCHYKSQSSVHNNAVITVATTSPIVDLLAIVTHVEMSQINNNRGSSLYVRIWIEDDTTTTSSFVQQQNNNNIKSSSLPVVQVLCFGQRRYTELIDQIQIRKGDILRFNRIIMMVPSSKRYNDSTTITFTYDDIYNPEIGPEYYRLGHVVSSDTENTTELYQQNDDNEIPLSMHTNIQCIHRLMEWYQQRYSSRMASTEIIEHHSSIKRNSNLVSLPCQHRTLAEFQSCIGLQGHTSVHVLHMEQFTATATTTPLRSYTTKKRQGNHIAAAPAKYIFVTLIDDLSSSLRTQQLASLVIDNISISNLQYTNFLSILSQARSSNRRVQLTNITSIRNHPQNQYRRHIPPYLLSDSTDGIIIPTYKSDISMIENEIVELSTIQPELIPLIPMQNNSDGRILEMFGIQSSILDITVWTSSEKKITISSSNFMDDASIELVLSLLFSQWINGSNQNNNSESISRVTIHLKSNDTTNPTIRVEADTNILSRLCGNGVVHSIAIEGRVSKGNRPSTKAKVTNEFDDVKCKEITHRDLMKRLLYSLVQEQVVLQWSIGTVHYRSQRDMTTTNETFFRVLEVWLTEI